MQRWNLPALKLSDIGYQRRPLGIILRWQSEVCTLTRHVGSFRKGNHTQQAQDVNTAFVAARPQSRRICVYLQAGPVYAEPRVRQGTACIFIHCRYRRRILRMERQEFRQSATLLLLAITSFAGYREVGPAGKLFTE